MAWQAKKHTGLFGLAIRWLARLVVLVAALVLTTLCYLVLQLLESIGQVEKDTLDVRSISVVEKPPPPPPPMEEEKEDEEEEEEPKLDEQAEPLDLSQLEVALNTNVGGGWGGDFGVDVTTHMAKAERMDAVFSLSELDQRPRPVYQPSPRYPPDLQRKGVEGTVTVAFIVDSDGRVARAKVQKSTHPGFERAALKAVKRWKFEPGKRDGKAVQFRMRVPITFSAG